MEYFSHIVKHFHKTAWLDVNNEFSGLNEFYVYIAYETLHVEERTETLVVDAGAFLAAVGGNLGLFLGFSCFSCFLMIIDLVGRYVRK